ncbi:MAG: protein kinase, partial [Thermoplasmatales archaeon]
MRSFRGYDIERILASNVNSKVYLACSENKKFVIKLINRSLLVDQKIQEEVFRREVDALKRFKPPVVPELIEAGNDPKEGCFFIITEYVPGRSLAEVLSAEKTLPSERVAMLGMEILSVLDFLHSKGLVHRDIKPANIIITSDGVRLVDFGISKNLASFDQGVTLTGKSFGTPEYMSPELASCEPTDHRSDLYSVGVVLYECLKGEPPFKAKTPMHTLLMVLTVNPPPIPFRPDCPPELEEVVFKALKKKKEDRFSSAEEFLRALEGVYRMIKNGYRREIQRTQILVDEKPAPVVKQRSRPLVYCLDDQVFILNILKHILTANGFDVYTFTSWEQLHAALAEEEPHLVITDVQMPEVNGVKVCSMLKNAFPEVKVVLFSNVYEDDLANLAQQAGADDWISKSWTPDVWLSKVVKFNISL